MVWILKCSLPWDSCISPFGEFDNYEMLLSLKMDPPADIYDDLPIVLNNFLSYVLGLPLHAAFHEIDYNSHIQAFQTYVKVLRRRDRQIPVGTYTAEG